MLADARRAHHRAQPSFGGLWRHHRNVTGYPGYNCVIGIDNATIGTILKDNGYATSWFGKNHNTPDYQYSTAGPFDQWPTGMGFDYFYGFMGGEPTSGSRSCSATPRRSIPWRDQPGWNLITGMADDAIQYLNELNASAPDKPFFLYYVPGGTHAPHHPTPNGSPSSRASSTWVGTRCASRSSPTRSGSV